MRRGSLVAGDRVTKVRRPRDPLTTQSRFPGRTCVGRGSFVVTHGTDEETGTKTVNAGRRRPNRFMVEVIYLTRSGLVPVPVPVRPAVLYFGQQGCFERRTANDVTANQRTAATGCLSLFVVFCVHTADWRRWRRVSL